MSKKEVQVARNGGEGEVIRAMPERKHFFLREVFPKLYKCNCHKVTEMVRERES